jgi:hypothetical protein
VLGQWTYNRAAVVDGLVAVAVAVGASEPRLSLQPALRRGRPRTTVVGCAVAVVVGLVVADVQSLVKEVVVSAAGPAHIVLSLKQPKPSFDLTTPFTGVEACRVVRVTPHVTVKVDRGEQKSVIAEGEPGS